MPAVEDLTVDLDQPKVFDRYAAASTKERVDFEWRASDKA